jgi:hypothetical protein
MRGKYVLNGSNSVSLWPVCPKELIVRYGDLFILDIRLSVAEKLEKVVLQEVPIWRI